MHCWLWELKPLVDDCYFVISLSKKLKSSYSIFVIVSPGVQIPLSKDFKWNKHPRVINSRCSVYENIPSEGRTMAELGRTRTLVNRGTKFWNWIFHLGYKTYSCKRICTKELKCHLFNVGLQIFSPTAWPLSLWKKEKKWICEQQQNLGYYNPIKKFISFHSDTRFLFTKIYTSW